jgi:RHS repeat-associated protein
MAMAARIVRVFEWYPEGPVQHERQGQLDACVPNPAGARNVVSTTGGGLNCDTSGSTVYFIQTDNGQVGFQVVLSDGQTYWARSPSYSSLHWARNYTLTFDWVQEYWNHFNYFGPGWICSDANDDGRCDLQLLRHPFSISLTDTNEHFGRFVTGLNFGVNPSLAEELEPVVLDTALTHADGDSDFSFDTYSHQTTANQPVGSEGYNFTQLVDLNGDGRMDWMNWRWAGSSVNAGVRTSLWTVKTQARRDWEAHTDSASLATADLNGDGLLDLVRTESWQPHLLIDTALRGADGTFRVQPTWESQEWPAPDGRGREMAIGDYNGDGRHDLLNLRYLSESDSLEARAYLSKGDGTFDVVVSAPAAPLPYLFRNRGSLRYGDVDGDGTGDVVQLSRVLFGLLRIDVLQSSRDGTFRAWSQVIDAADIPGRSTALHLADVNGDGRADLVGAWSLPAGGVLAYSLLAEPQGWRRVRSELPDRGVVLHPNRWHVADVNADNLMDLQQLSANETGGRYDLWLTQLRALGDGTWAARATRTVRGYPTADVLSWETPDINGDGKSDWIHARASDSPLSVTTLVTTPGQIALRKEWTSAASTNYPALMRWHSIVQGNGNHALEAVTSVATAMNQATLGLGSGVRVHTFRPQSAPDRIRGATAPLGSDLAIQYSSTAGTVTPNPADTTCYLPPGIAVQTVSDTQASDGRGTSGTNSTYTHVCPHWSQRERRVIGFKSEQQVEAAVINRPPRTVTQAFTLDDRCGRQLASRKTTDGTPAFTASVFVPVDPGSTAPFRCEVAEKQESEADANGLIGSTHTTYAYNPFGKVTTLTEFGDSGSNGDERRTEQRFTLLSESFRVVQDSIEVYPAASGGTRVAAQRFCHDGHTGTPGSDCGHVATDAGLPTLSRVWDDHKDLWYDTTTQYDSVGNAIRVTDPLGHATQTDWDPLQHLFAIRITNAKGHIEEITWDTVHGAEISRKDPNGVTPTTATYDALGRVRTMATVDGGLTRYEYLLWGDAGRQQVRKVVTDGARELWTQSFFDGFGRIWQEERRNGRGDGDYQRSWDYSDSSINPLAAKGWHDRGTAATHVERYGYDFRDRVTRVEHADGTALENRYLTRRTVARDEIGNRIEASADAYGRVAALTEYPSDDSTITNPSLSRFAYDTLGHLIERLDAKGNRWVYHTNALGQAWQVDDPDAGTRHDDYDAAGHIIRRQDGRGIGIDYAYDELNRLKSRSGPSRSVTWLYDEPGVAFGIGRLTSIQDSSNACGKSRSLVYDALGRTTVETLCVNGDSQRLEFSYDTIGRQKSIRYPDGEVVQYGYDFAGRLSDASGVASATYDAEDRLVTRTLANGVSESRVFDGQHGWLLQESVRLPQQPAGASAFSAAYTYLSNGLLKTNDESYGVTGLAGALSPSALHREYQYDGVRRLLSARVSAAPAPAPELPNGFDAQALVEQFTYDAIGNVLSQTSLGSYGYGPNAANCTQHMACGGGPHGATTVGDRWLGYDAAGNVTAIGDASASRRLEYDDASQLLAVVEGTAANAPRVTLAYDAAGERTAKTVHVGGENRTTRYFGRYLEREPNGTLVKLYFLGDRLIARREGAALSYLSADRLDSVRVVTDASGQLTTLLDYSAFGRTALGNVAQSGSRAFTGHRLDTELGGIGDAGLLYMGARYYDPALARFLSPDAVVANVFDPQSWNPYSYVVNGPAVAIDPDGQRPDFDLPSDYVKAGLPPPSVKAETVVTMAAIGVAGWLFPVPTAVILAIDALEGIANAPETAEARLHSRPSNYVQVGKLTLAVVPGVAGIRAARAANRAALAATGEEAAAVRGSGAAGEDSLATGARGSRDYPMRNLQRTRNARATIESREYSGHALDQMQNRGLMPSVVEHAIQTGTSFPTKAGTLGFYDVLNDFRVITNAETGRVVTVIPGPPR